MQTQKRKHLSDIKKGHFVKVVGISGGKALVYRLNTMGIIPGTPVKIVQSSKGPVIIEARGSRIALGRGMISKIEVETAD
ncbi:MAG TPA: ferrous iron transport protein A [Firmicutes bacterium]|nr:ferrous iron transport protein A [Bacillota bacterium]